MGERERVSSRMSFIQQLCRDIRGNLCDSNKSTGTYTPVEENRHGASRSAVGLKYLMIMIPKLEDNTLISSRLDDYTTRLD